MNQPIRVLYLHPSATFGGASKSLIELCKAMGLDNVSAHVLSPRGSSSKAFESSGMKVETVKGLSQFDNTLYGHYRRLRWFVLLREMFYLPETLRALFRLSAKSFDLVHVNEITLLPIAIVAKKLLGVPLVVHVRSVQCEHSATLRSRFLTRMLKKYADAVVPIDYTVRDKLPSDLPIHIVRNGFLAGEESTVSGPSSEVVCRKVRVGYIGVLSPMKGVYELLEAVAILRDRGIIVDCHLAGHNIRDVSGVMGALISFLGFSGDVRSQLEQFVQTKEISAQVHFCNFVQDTNKFFRELDILCFPSKLNAAGRPVFEAAFFSVPSVIVIDRTFPDSVVNQETGLTVEKCDPHQIADAIQKLVIDRGLRASMGAAARQWAHRYYRISENAAKMLRIYRDLCAKSCLG